MNTILSKALIFTAGAAIGSAVTYMLTKKKFEGEYERRLAEDTASVKEAFMASIAESDTDTCDRETPSNEDIQDPDPAPSLSRINSMMRNLDYIAEDSVDISQDEKRSSTVDDAELPQVIDPEEYGDYADYDAQTLYYYTDDVLADDMDNVVEDVEGCVGSFALTTFGMYEDDAVHVRNDARRCYYEVLRSECAYSEKYGQNLYRKEDE